MTRKELKNRANNKCFAKQLAILNKIQEYKEMEPGSITQEMIDVVIKQSEIEFEVWEYIREKINAKPKF